SVGRPVAESLGGGTGVRVGRGGRGRRPREGNDEHVNELNGQGNDQGINGVWWNSQIHTRSQEIVVGMSWDDFKVLMRKEFCPSNEMQKLETKLWKHAMVGAGHVTKVKPFDWGEEQENAFQTLRDKLGNAPVLALPDGPKDFVVYCDRSGIGLGCVLMQRELFSDYDCEIRYHPGKANVVADAQSRKERVKPKRVRDMNIVLQSSIKDRILATQKEAMDESAGLQRGLDEMIELRNDGALYYPDRIWVPLKGDIRTLIMDEAHRLSIRGHLACSINMRFPNGNGKG
ncbi:putative reverse transcriptase domain-containing protein, partial [Tanacetum coccineum]